MADDKTKKSRKGLLIKLGIGVALVIAIIAARPLVGDYLTIEKVKDLRDQLEAWKEAHFWAMLGAYIGIYIVVTAASLPGAAVMTLAGGAIFGLWWGTAATSIASTTGATLAMLVSRYLIGDWVQTRFGERLDTFNAGVEREGPFYLFAVRLVPVFPFFVINLLMGLTKMRAGTFFLVSMAGMLPGTIAYVNAGTQLGQVESLSGLVSWQVIGSFAILAVLPFALRYGVRAWRRWRGLDPKVPGDQENDGD